jgi:hypothetical protein
MFKYVQVETTINPRLKFPFMEFSEMLGWYPDGLSEDALDILQVAWKEERENIKEAFFLAQKRDRYKAKK